ncbi:MAG: 50S ribosomal protein L3 [Planctomycetota bacterium]
MAIGILGRKLGMTRTFDKNGNTVPVTVIEAGPCPVIQVKTRDKEGYDAVQLGFLPKRDNLLKKPEYYHFLKYGVNPVRFVREFRTNGGPTLKSGDMVTVAILTAGVKVDITGTSRGHGFQGVVKRFHFRGSPASHGAEACHRRCGSIGNNTDPSRIWPGKKMPGHMGCDRVTIRNLDVITIDPEKNLICVRGAVPGSRGALLEITPKQG